MTPQEISTYHLVKNEDLNHHGTLYAGRTAEWLIEAGFIAAANLTDPARIVLLQINDVTFMQPLRCGEIVCFESRIVKSTGSKLVSYVSVLVNGLQVVEGYLTFMHLDENGNVSPHGIVLEENDPEELD